MKTLLKAVAALCLIAGTLHAQTPSHSATLAWTEPADITPTSTITVLRASGACTGTPNFTVLATAQPIAGPYVDTTVTVGTWCYTVQHVVNGASSVNSNLAATTVSPLPASGLTITVK